MGNGKKYVFFGVFHASFFLFPIFEIMVMA